MKITKIDKQAIARYLKQLFQLINGTMLMK